MIVEVKGNLFDFVTDINNDINNLSARLSGINITSSKLSLTNDTKIEASILTGDGGNRGSIFSLEHDWISLICNGEDSDGKTVLKGKISIGPTIEDNFGLASTNPIDLICLGNTGVHHSILVGKE
jgi:hypothetical protein